MSPARHRYRFPIPSHPTVLPVSIVDLLFSVSFVHHLSALCVQLFPLLTLCFHQLTSCFFLNSPVFNASALPYVFSKSIPQRKITMTHSASKPNFINNSARCVHFYPNGRRCRLSATNLNSHFCPAHTRLPQNLPDPAEIASTLTANLDDFTSAAQINDFLSRLLLLLAQDKISARRAAVLAYITNQLLRTLPAIAKENDEPAQIIFDMPGPDRDRPEPEQNPPQHAAPTRDHDHQETQGVGTNDPARA
jgi:hypothetical protein